MPASGFAQEKPAAEPVSFVKDIAPILVSRCLGCHGAEKPKGSFALHTVDAFNKALGSFESRVYKGRGSFALLGSLSRTYTTLVQDSVRVQNRIKSVYRSRGLTVNGKAVYAHATRGDFMQRLPASMRPRVRMLYEEFASIADVNALEWSRQATRPR